MIHLNVMGVRYLIPSIRFLSLQFCIVKYLQYSVSEDEEVVQMFP